MEKYYEAHHIAELHPLFINHPEDCIILLNEDDGKGLKNCLKKENVV